MLQYNGSSHLRARGLRSIRMDHGSGHLVVNKDEPTAHCGKSLSNLVQVFAGHIAEFAVTK